MAFIVRYASDVGPRYGLLADGDVHQIVSDALGERGPHAGPLIGPVDDLTLLPPVQPGKIICIGRNYADHAAEHQATVPDEPMLFFKPPSALIAHGETIHLPPNVGRIDHEAELAVVIGQRTRHANRANALDAVWGYTCANDVSARAYQKKDGQWGRAKGFDTFCPLGPWINTELDPTDLAVRCILNGAVTQDSRTAHMVFDVPALIAFISGVMTLEPGDVILTGTPAGVSELHDGDTVRVEIEGIGLLENRVKAD